MGFNKIVAVSMTDLFVQQIENMILSGELAIGEQLPPARELSVKMGVSRTVISAGLVELEKLGFVEIRTRQGVFVCDYRRKGSLETLIAIMRYNGGAMRKNEVKSLLETRDAMECLCLRLVCEKNDVAELERLSPILDSIRDARNADEAAERVFSFHHELAIMSGNVLQNAVDEVAHHQGNVWTPVIAIQRSDAERLGYDSAESWRSLICSEIDQIAKAYKILPSRLKWYAAFHEKERSVHVHLVIFSTDPNEGYLTKPAILELRSALTRQIFKDDLKNIYVQQTAYREQLQENALEVMDSLIQEMQNGEISNPKLELLITELAERLQNYSGKKVYGYLPLATKRIADAIVDNLASNERVAEAYSLWQDMRDEVFSFYSKSKPERVPLSQQKEFKPVRNMVIREVVQMIQKRPR